MTWEKRLMEFVIVWLKRQKIKGISHEAFKYEAQYNPFCKCNESKKSSAKTVVI